MKRYMLIGNYGVGNFGDEAMLAYFTSHYPEVQWNIVSASPTKGQYARLPLGVRSFFTRWPATIVAYIRSDGVVFGGGTLFTDIESLFACVLWGAHALLAIVLRKNIYLAFQGIGPHTTTMGAWITHFICARATSISVRDTASFGRLQRMNVLTPVEQTFDPVLSLVSPTATDNSTGTPNTLVLIPRHNSSNLFIEQVSLHVERVSYDSIHILSFQPNDPAEILFCTTVLQKFPHAQLHPVTTLEEAQSLIGAASQVISQRFHGTVLAKALGKPVIVVHQEVNDKHTQLLHDMSNLQAARERIAVTENNLRETLR